METKGPNKKGQQKKSPPSSFEECDSLYHDFFDKAFFGILHISTKGKLLQVNFALAKMLGYNSTSEMIAHIKNVNDNLCINNINFKNLIKKSLESNDWIKSEMLCRRKDGSIISTDLSLHSVVRPNGSLCYLEGVIYDITNRKISEENIHNQFFTLKGINESIGSPIFSVDTNFRYTSFNSVHAAFIRSLYGTEIKLGDSVLDSMTVEEDKIKAIENLDKAIKGEYLIEESYAGDNEFSRRFFEISHNPIKENDGKIVGVAVLAMDLTERRKMELKALNSQQETLRLLESEEKSAQVLLSVLEDEKIAREEIKKLNEGLELKVLKRTEELEIINKELETFTYSVSHDLKAPLRGIDGYSKLLQDIYKNQLNEEARTFIKNIRSSTLKMNQLIDDLLEYSKLERSQQSIQAIEVRKLIDLIVSTFATELEKHNFSLEINSNEVEVLADSKGLTIALRNLIENAIKFSKDHKSPNIKIEIKDNASSWIICIADNGIGFDSKFDKKIFNIFQRLHRAEDYPGTGIGLAMVQKAIQRMNGKVWANSKPNKGATFFLELPKTK